MTAADMPTSAVLNKAADLIEERGWAQGPDSWGRDATSGLCIEGGIIAALGVELDPWSNPIPGWEAFWTCRAYLAVSELLGLNTEAVDQFGDPANPLWRWNDIDARTAEQVIATLRAAAVIEAARENQPEQVTA